MNAFWICTMLSLVSSIFAEDISEVKTQEKRGVVGVGYGNAHGVGYGGHYFGGHGYGYNGIGHGLGLGHGYGHGYLAAPSYSAVNHAVAAPTISHASYAAPLALSHGYHGYSHGYNAPLYSAPIRVGYAGLGHSGIAHSGIAHNGIAHSGFGNGLGYNYGHGW